MPNMKHGIESKREEADTDPHRQITTQHPQSHPPLLWFPGTWAQSQQPADWNTDEDGHGDSSSTNAYEGFWRLQATPGLGLP